MFITDYQNDVEDVKKASNSGSDMSCCLREKRNESFILDHGIFLRAVHVFAALYLCYFHQAGTEQAYRMLSRDIENGTVML